MTKIKKGTAALNVRGTDQEPWIQKWNQEVIIWKNNKKKSKITNKIDGTKTLKKSLIKEHDLKVMDTLMHEWTPKINIKSTINIYPLNNFPNNYQLKHLKMKIPRIHLIIRKWLQLVKRLAVNWPINIQYLQSDNYLNFFFLI